MTDDFRNHTPATNAAYEAAIADENNDDSHISVDRMRDFAAGLERTLREIEKDALALSEQIAAGETSEQTRDQARAIAAKCAAALAGTK